MRGTYSNDVVIDILPPSQNKCLNFVQTLVQSCTTTKVDTYFGTEVTKEKNNPCSP